MPVQYPYTPTQPDGSDMHYVREEWLTNVQPPNQVSPFDKGFIAQRKKEDEAKQKSGLKSDTTPIGHPYRVSLQQPDEPNLNGKIATVSGGSISYGNLTQPVIDASAFPARRDRQGIIYGNGVTTGRVKNSIVLSLPTTEGFGTKKLSGFYSPNQPAAAKCSNDLGRVVIARPGASSSAIL